MNKTSINTSENNKKYIPIKLSANTSQDKDNTSSSDTREHDIDTEIILISALGFIISTAWSNFFTDLINGYYPIDKKSNLRAKFIYAFILTFLIVIVAYVVNLIFRAGEKVVKEVKKIPSLIFSIPQCINQAMTYSTTGYSLGEHSLSSVEPPVYKYQIDFQ